MKAQSIKRLLSVRMQPIIDRFYSKKDSDSEKLARLAEVKFSGFIAEHNLPFAGADHLAKLTKVSFPDSKVAKSYANGKTKTTCILKRAICPDLTSKFVAKMKSSPFSLSTDGNNDQSLEKINPLTAKLFDEDKLVTLISLIRL